MDVRLIVRRLTDLTAMDIAKIGAVVVCLLSALAEFVRWIRTP